MKGATEGCSVEVAVPRIFIDRLGSDYLPKIAAGFQWIGVDSRLRAGDRVAIKPNLTFPLFRKGVMTNPEAVEALILYLKNFTDKITICESDSGGYNPFSMSEVFTSTGIADFARRHGVQVVNMSHVPAKEISFRRRLRTVSVPLPAFLLEETDCFITMPVPKVHLNTRVSLSLKNQWGVIQQPSLRLKLHPMFADVIYWINKQLPRPIAVVDGRYGLTRTGPLRGDVVELNWLMVGDSLFHVDYAVTELMGLHPRQVPHLRKILAREGIRSLEGVEFNQDLEKFKSTSFYLEREWTDYPGLITFNSRVMAYIGYESFLAKPLHWLLYKFREPFY